MFKNINLFYQYIRVKYRFRHYIIAQASPTLFRPATPFLRWFTLKHKKFCGL